MAEDCPALCRGARRLADRLIAEGLLRKVGRVNETPKER